MTQDAYIVAYGRSPVGKGKKSGAYYLSRPEDIAAQVLSGVLNRVGGDFTSDMVEDLILGVSQPENLQGMNIARKVVLRAGLSERIAAQTINRFCSSGLQSIATAANAIIAGQSDILVAGGLEFQSTTPPGSAEMTNTPYLEKEGQSVAVSMGITAENVAERYNVSAEEQNAFAVSSHQKAHEAQTTGRFEDEIIPVNIQTVDYDESGDVISGTKVFDTDQGIRPNSNIETLSKLPTIFKQNGTVTAGNASQISDGTAFVVLMSGDKVEELGVKPIAKFRGFKVTGVDPAYMGIGPIYAIPQVLKLTGLSLKDMDIIELNEAFASQTLAIVNELGIDKGKLNPNGGAIALGHPNGATGAILTARMLAEMKKREDAKYGMVTMCIGSGMGAAGIFEFIR